LGRIAGQGGVQMRVTIEFGFQVLEIAGSGFKAQVFFFTGKFSSISRLTRR